MNRQPLQEAVFHERGVPQPGQLPTDRYTGQNFTVACT